MLSWLLVSTISIYSCGHRHALGIVICSMKHSWPSDEEQSPPFISQSLHHVLPKH
uniref:Uncharacterized protein n=1 Tax=Anguilla anguilla TaxID=7936 RepID=A0A0E9U621_ANGAN